MRVRQLPGCSFPGDKNSGAHDDATSGYVETCIGRSKDPGSLKRGERFQGRGYVVGNKTEPLLKTPPANTSVVPIVRQTLTIEERKEQTEKDLCFNCDE